MNKISTSKEVSLSGGDDTQVSSLSISRPPYFYSNENNETAKNMQQNGDPRAQTGGGKSPGIRWWKHQNEKRSKNERNKTFHSSGASKGGGGGGRLPPVAAADAARLRDT